MSASAIQMIHVPRVEIVRSADRLGKRLIIAGYSYDMNMIAHQAVSQHMQTEALRLTFEQFQVNLAIIISKENVLLIIAALDDMVRRLWYNYSSDPWHDRKYTKHPNNVNI